MSKLLDNFMVLFSSILRLLKNSFKFSKAVENSNKILKVKERLKYNYKYVLHIKLILRF